MWVLRLCLCACVCLAVHEVMQDNILSGVAERTADPSPK